MLSQVTALSTIPRALEIYDEIRRPFSQDIQRLSLRSGITVLMDKSGEVTLGPDHVQGDLLGSAEDLGKLFAWSWTTSVMPDWDRAVDAVKSIVNVS